MLANCMYASEPPATLIATKQSFSSIPDILWLSMNPFNFEAELSVPN